MLAELCHACAVQGVAALKLMYIIVHSTRANSVVNLLRCDPYHTFGVVNLLRCDPYHTFGLHTDLQLSVGNLLRCDPYHTLGVDNLLHNHFGQTSLFR